MVDRGREQENKKYCTPDRQPRMMIRMFDHLSPVVYPRLSRRSAWGIAVLACWAISCGGTPQGDAVVDAQPDAQPDVAHDTNEDRESGDVSQEPPVLDVISEPVSEVVCNSRTCAQLGAECGYISDGCGKYLFCEDCTGGRVCGSLVPNRCGPGCVPKTCAAQGAACGSISDGCGATQDCGSCNQAGESCAGGGTDNRCGCACQLPHATASCLSGVCSVSQCNSGWADCDGQPDDGCEVNIGTEIHNCGACGKECVGTNGIAGCVDGTCVLQGCLAGYGDCDQVAENGCEANLQADPMNCLVCGNICPANGGNPVCIQTVCSVSNCPVGQADCDGNASNGCETDTTSSVANCGYCGHACAFANATAFCAGGTCEFAACDATHGDCDSVQANGCETNLQNSPLHCGSCSTVCTAPTNSTAACVGAVCTFACKSGFGDCDSNAATGCEADLSSDIAACGACGHACSTSHTTPQCVAGNCIGTCQQGFADCNSNMGQDGCEADLLSPDHCGACANVCSNNHMATRTCSNSTCTGTCAAGNLDCNNDKLTDGCETAGSSCSVTCTPPFKDCDGNPANGCETNSDTDIANCGACGQACSTNHESVACVAGGCTVTCEAGFGNCNNDMRTDGCEAALTSPDYCGSCSASCSSNHMATRTCSGGVCSGTCATGYVDCNNNKLSDGCEVNRDSDPNNCGGCTLSCSNSNMASRTCNAGVCTGACNPGYQDCNGDKQVDGCESQVTNDPDNCGACGVSCSSWHMGTRTCAAGVCNGYCSGYWYDCNSNKQTDGCETDISYCTGGEIGCDTDELCAWQGGEKCLPVACVTCCYYP